MGDNLSKHTSDSGWAIIEIGTQACFSSSSSAVEFYFDESEKCAVEIAFGDAKKEFLIEKPEAEEFLKKIIFLGRKPEVRSESYWTKSVHAKVEWRNLAFAEERAGKLSAFSNEWTIEEMKEHLPKIKDAKIAEEIKEMLAKGLHRRAIEINLETRKFVKQFFPV